MRIVYQSEDGKLFASEQRCLQHEQELKLAKYKELKDAIDQVTGELNLLSEEYEKAANLKKNVHIDQSGRIILTFERGF